MKKLICACLSPLLLAGMLTASAGAAGTRTDPLVSLSYINGEFTDKLKAEGKAEADKILTAAYDAAITRLTEATGSYSGYSFADGFTEVYLAAGKTVELVSGASFILTTGAATLNVTRGAVINASTGNAVASGSLLTALNRYFCAEDTACVITASERSLGQVDGYYKTDGAVGYATVFKDVKMADWYFDAVEYVYDNGLFTGTSADVFSPGAAMTRGMFVTVLHRLAEKPGSTSQSPFSDVSDSSQYYYAAVVWANGNGVVTGYDDGTFLPNSSITREQMAVIMHRYAALTGKSAGADGAAFDTFPDKTSVSTYAVDAMKWATSVGIINGADGKLLPGSTATRAQVAQIILNFCEKTK